MLLDPEVQRASADSVWLVGEATRLFLQALAAKAAAAVSSKKRKTINLQDFETLIRSVAGVTVAVLHQSCMTPWRGVLVSSTLGSLAHVTLHQTNDELNALVCCGLWLIALFKSCWTSWHTIAAYWGLNPLLDMGF